jgi:hypothetical protein
LPAYALAAFPVADLIVRFILGWRHRLPAILVATGVLVFVGGQAAAAALQVPVQQVDRHNYAVVARQLHALGIRAPCTLDGVDAPPVAYYAGCSSVVPHGGRGPHGEAEWIAYAHRVNLAVVVQVHTHLPSYARRWPSYRVPGTRKHTWVIYLPP